jgi:hypothetical protein
MAKNRPDGPTTANDDIPSAAKAPPPLAHWQVISQNGPTADFAVSEIDRRAFLRLPSRPGDDELYVILSSVVVWSISWTQTTLSGRICLLEHSAFCVARHWTSDRAQNPLCFSVDRRRGMGAQETFRSKPRVALWQRGSRSWRARGLGRSLTQANLWPDSYGASV